MRARTIRLPAAGAGGRAMSEDALSAAARAAAVKAAGRGYAPPDVTRLRKSVLKLFGSYDACARECFGK